MTEDFEQHLEELSRDLRYWCSDRQLEMVAAWLIRIAENGRAEMSLFYRTSVQAARGVEIASQMVGEIMGYREISQREAAYEVYKMVAGYIERD